MNSSNMSMSMKFVEGKCLKNIKPYTCITATARNRKDTDDIFEELLVAENLSLFYHLHNLPECLFMFWPPVL